MLFSRYLGIHTCAAFGFQSQDDFGSALFASIPIKYPDFNSIVTDDAIATLKQQHPEIAESLHALRNNPYKQAKAIYDAVKGLVPQKAQSAQQMLDKKRATENAAKPMSVQAAPKQSVLGNAQIFENGLTPELKKQLQKEMEEAIKRF